MRRAWMLMTMLVFALAACGGDSAEDTAASTEPTEASTTSTTAATTTTSTTQPTTTTTTEPPPVLSSDDNITLRAFGPVVIGMTVDEASEAAGMVLEGALDPAISDTCYYVTPDASVKGISFMVFEDRIARVEIADPSTVTTRSGAGIGTTAEELAEIYPDNIQEADEAVFDGEALGFVPNDDGDAEYRIFFELDEEGVVVRYRAGIKPAVDFIEGCA